MRRTITEAGTIKSGNITITTKGPPLEFEDDPRALAAGPAKAIRDATQEGLEQAARSIPRLAHGANWLASDVQLTERRRGVYEISVPGPSEPLLRALERDVLALRKPFEPKNVQSALRLADDVIARARRI